MNYIPDPEIDDSRISQPKEEVCPHCGCEERGKESWDCGTYFADNEEMGNACREAALNKAWEEIVILNKRLHDIHLEVDGYIDGAPDRSEASSLANRVQAILDGHP